MNQDFEIKGSVLERYNGNASHVVVPSGVTEIGAMAFMGGDLESVELPEGVTSIGRCAFTGAKGLRQVKLPSTLVKISQNAFWECTSLAEIELPSGILTIGYCAFKNCKSLVKITLPNTLKSIGREAFSGCTALSSVSFVALPSIDDSAFYKCVALRTLIVPSAFWDNSYAWLLDRFEESVLFTIMLNSLPSDHKHIKAMLDTPLRVMTALISADNAPAVVDYLALFGALDLEDLDNYITLSSAAHALECTSTLLSYKSINYSREEIERAALSKQAKDLGLIPYELKDWRRLLAIKQTPQGLVIEAILPTCKQSSIILPAQIDGIAVVEIAEHAFENSKIEHISLPAVKSIGKDAFRSCRALREVSVPRGVSLGDGAFKGCWALSDDNGFVIVNDVVFDYIGDGESVVIPAGIREISADAFAIMTMATVEVPEGVIRIGDGAFRDALYLSRINLPQSLQSIGERAFAGCDSLRQITIPHSVRSYPPSAFEGDDHIKINRY